MKKIWNGLLAAVLVVTSLAVGVVLVAAVIAASAALTGAVLGVVFRAFRAIVGL